MILPLGFGILRSVPNTTPDSYIACRTYGHAWFEAPVVGEWATGWQHAEPVALKCERCDAERHDIVDRSGQVVRRKYVYPPNFRYPKAEKPSIQDMRLALIALQRQAKRDRKAMDRQNARALASV